MGRRTFDPEHPELQDLFDPSRLCAWLAEQLGGARAGQATPRRARVERWWPARGGLRFQWTYLPGHQRGRHSLYAVPARAADRAGHASADVNDAPATDDGTGHGGSTLRGEHGPHTPPATSTPQASRGRLAPNDRARADRFAPTEIARAGRLTPIDPPCPGVPDIADPPGAAGLRRYVASLDLVVHTADCDAGLPQVATLLDADALRAFVADWLPDGASAVRTSLLGYKPGRRAAVRIEARVGRSWQTLGVVKTIRAKARKHEGTKARSAEATQRRSDAAMEGARAQGAGHRVPGSPAFGSDVSTFPPSHLSTPLACWHAALADQLRVATGGRVAVPRVLGEIPALHAVLIKWVEGRRLGAGATLGAGELHATAAALATFHQLEAPAGVPAFDRSRELAVLERWLEVLERIRPRKAAHGRRLLEALAAASGLIETQPPVLLHRDFYEKQLVWSEDCTTILDLDTLATGEAALDAGNLIAHAALYQMTHRRAPVTMADLHALADAVLQAYRTAGGHVADGAVWWYAASSLARGGALHGLRTLTRRVSPWMWEASEAVLKQLGASRAVHAAIK